MRKLGLVMALLVLLSLFSGIIGCAKAPVEKPPTTTPTTPGSPTTPTVEKPFKPIKLKYGDLRSHRPGPFGEYAAPVPFIMAVEALSNGRIDVVPYPDGTLLTFEMAEMQIAGGVAEMGQTGRVQSGILPLKDLGNLPPIYSHTSAIGQQMIMWFFVQDYYRKDYEAMNLVNLAPQYLHASLIVTAKKPVRSMADIKGLTLISVDPSTIRLFTRLGATMLPITNNFGYEPLSKGLADGGIWNWGGPYRMWLEALRPGYFADAGGVTFSGQGSNVDMNKQVFDSLPADLQEILKFAGWRWGSINFAAYIDSTIPLYRDGLAPRRGIQYIVWSDEEKAKFAKEKAKLWDEWTTEMEKLYKRGAEAAELVKVYGEAAKKYVPPAPPPIQPELGGDKAKWEATFGPGSTWGRDYKAYPNQVGIYKLEGNEFRPWK